MRGGGSTGHTSIGTRDVAAIAVDDIIAQIRATRAAGGARMRKGDEIYLKTEKEIAKEEATRSFMKCEQRRSGRRAHEHLKNETRFFSRDKAWTLPELRNIQMKSSNDSGALSANGTQLE